MNRSLIGMRVGSWSAIVGMVVLLGVSMLTLGIRDHAVAQTPAAATATDQAATSYAKSLSKAFREAASKVLPAVVMIKNMPNVREEAPSNGNAEEMQENPFEDPFNDMLPPEFRKFFKEMPRMPHRGMPHGGELGVGSGVIIDPSGVILTNNHVVEGGGKIIVRLHDGREFTATDVKTDPKTDLAIVRIKDSGAFPAVKLGNSDDVQVGDWVLALGDPFGLEGTVTAGIVSAKGRALGNTPRENFIQTDAAINPGNSGGPLVNLDGEIIGINTAITSRSGGNQGVGFAISANLAKWVSQQLTAQGTVKRAYLGVAIQPVSQDLAKQFGVENRQGAVVADVGPNTPAATAGLKTGDVIVEFAGKSVANPQELQQAVEQAPIGAKSVVTIIREGKRQTLDVVTQEQPAEYGLARGNSKTPGGKEGTARETKLGIEVANLTPEVAEKLGVKAGEGVVITGVRDGSPASLGGLASGMVILQVGQKPVKTVEDFRAAMQKHSMKEGVMLLVRSAQGTRFVVIRSS